MARNNYKAYLCIKDGKLCVANHLVKRLVSIDYEKKIVIVKTKFLIRKLNK